MPPSYYNYYYEGCICTALHSALFTLTCTLYHTYAAPVFHLYATCAAPAYVQYPYTTYTYTYTYTYCI